MFIIVGYIRGAEQLWLLGDEFLTKAYGHFNGVANEEAGIYFTKDHYEVKMFAGNNLDPEITTPLARIRSEFIKAVEEHILLPKVVVIILDNDLIKHADRNSSYVYSTLIHWLASEFNKIVEVQKDRLPIKAKKLDGPTFIWIAPPQNINFVDNDERVKMEKSMRKMINIQNNHMLLRMVNIWEPNNRNLYWKGKFTEVGFEKLWYSIDSAIQFWEQHLAPKGKLRKYDEAKRSYSSFSGRRFEGFNKFGSNPFKWSKDNRRRDEGRKLPTPPPRR